MMIDDINSSRRIYPEWLKQPYTQNAHNLAETMGRIANRIDEWQALLKEKDAALAWCMTNGNPHKIPEGTA